VVATRPVDRSPQPIGKRCSRHCRRHPGGPPGFKGKYQKLMGVRKTDTCRAKVRRNL